MAVSAAKMACCAAGRGIGQRRVARPVSVMCTDKTGTLKTMRRCARRRSPGEGVRRERAGARPLRRQLPVAQRGTLDAVHEAKPAGDGAASRSTAQVPSSSCRRWSALELDGGRHAPGAPEALLDGAGLFGAQCAAEQAATGRCRAPALIAADGPLPRPPSTAPPLDLDHPLGAVAG